MLHLFNHSPRNPPANRCTRRVEMSSNIDVIASQWKYVEVGRVVLFLKGPFAGRLATIAEIIDHKRVCFA